MTNLEYYKAMGEIFEEVYIELNNEEYGYHIYDVNFNHEYNIVVEYRDSRNNSNYDYVVLETLNKNSQEILDDFINIMHDRKVPESYFDYETEEYVDN